MKCYDYGYKFVKKYNNSPHNLIIKHVVKRARGKSNTGQIFYNVNFTPVCYHANNLHIFKEKPRVRRDRDDFPIFARKTWERNTDSI